MLPLAARKAQYSQFKARLSPTKGLASGRLLNFVRNCVRHLAIAHGFIGLRARARARTLDTE
jgi:hypothetical protein